METANGTTGSNNVKKKKSPKMILAFDSEPIFIIILPKDIIILPKNTKVLLLYSYIILMYVAISFKIRE